MSDSGGGVGYPIGDVTYTTNPEQYNSFPLESWRKQISYHPFHFWGLSNTDQVPVSSQCNALVKQYAWQGTDAAGRSEIRAAILSAENLLREYLGFSIGPKWINETIQFPRPMAYGQQFAAHIGGDGRWLSVRASEGYIRSAGVEAYALIDDEANVVYSDADGDGLDDTFTITISTSLTDPSEIGVYFASDDWLDGVLSERWRIAPVKILIDEENDLATITGSRWLLVKPVLYEGIVTAGGKDPADDDNFVNTVAVYRHYTDPTGTTNDTCHALLVWETAPFPSWAIGCCADSITYTTNSRDPAAVAYGIARAEIRDARLGEIAVGRAVYDSNNDEWIGASWGTCRQPDRVILRYEAGARLSAIDNTTNLSLINGSWDTVVARLAAAELNQRICACDMSNRELYRWQHDLGLDGNANLSNTDADNPLGTRAGAIYAWRRIQHLQLTEAMILR